ncbi:MAG: ABC transporter substrate-binding protein [Clostridiales bacterium]|nr:ABC transporter substrate-binding protein [Clostridiales bacterium]
MKKNRLMALLVSILLLSGLFAGALAQDEKIVNIGVTDALGTLSPLLQDGGELNKYATGLLFLPLVELGADMEFHGMLAQSITTEDNMTFTVTLNPDATWSDGTPISAKDVLFTVLRLTNMETGSSGIFGYASLVGFDENGFSPAGATELEGVKVIDDHTLHFISKEPMALSTFQNAYARYLFTMPEHVLKDIPAKDLTTHEFFTNPTVVSGPYTLVSVDRDHYIQYKANDQYFKGRPNIDRLNFKIVEGSQLYAGLESGEIDITLPTTAIIPVEDYEMVENIAHVTTLLEEPITNQLVFIHNDAVPDPKVRQAMLYAINRPLILEGLLGGKGDIIDGFLTSYSPYFDESLIPLAYDVEKAKALVQEAGWDSTRVLELLINAGDATFAKAADVIVANLAQVGIQVQVKAVDFHSLMTAAGTSNYDMYAVHYTIAPVDFYIDIDWLAGTGNNSKYTNAKVDELLVQTQRTDDRQELTAIYRQIDDIMQEEAPLLSIYVTRVPGAKNNRLINVEPRAYGAFIEVEKWDVE